MGRDEIEARMDIIKLLMQSILVLLFGTIIGVAKGDLEFASKPIIGLFFIIILGVLGVAIFPLKNLYIDMGKALKGKE